MMLKTRLMVAGLSLSGTLWRLEVANSEAYDGWAERTKCGVNYSRANLRVSRGLGLKSPCTIFRRAFGGVECLISFSNERFEMASAMVLGKSNTHRHGTRS